MTKRESAYVALAHLDAAIDHLQALHGLKLDESINRVVILAQKVSRGIEADVKASANIKDDQAAVYLPAFPKRTQRHIKPLASSRCVR